MPSPNCVVHGCKSRFGISKHRFPKNDVPRFILWIEKFGNPKFLKMSYDQIYLVCDLHFKEECHSYGTKLLNRNSIPTVSLPLQVCE